MGADARLFTATPERRPLSVVVAAAAILALLALAGCKRAPTPGEEAEQPEGLRLFATGFDALSGWADNDPRRALAAWRRSCVRIEKADGAGAFYIIAPKDGIRPPNFGPAAEWQKLCRDLQRQSRFESDASARRWVEERFRPYRVESRDGPEGLFTGYFEPELDGAHKRDAVNKYPVYQRPGDLVMVDLGEFRPELKGDSIAGRVDQGRLRPYDTRRDIDGGALDGRAEPIAWVRDPVSLFFLHIQGSGRIRFDNGQALRIGYAGHNGYKYVSVGAILRERGVTELTSDAIADWLRRHPDDAPAIMQQNARFIFFRKIEGDGPIGAEGTALTAGHSLAVDPAYLPYGAPLWLETTRPNGGGPMNRLMIAQDTGAAIKGVVRGDIFWGTGAEIGREAGAMKNRGRYHILLPAAVKPYPAEMAGNPVPR